jgi:hypothetical protein
MRSESCRMKQFCKHPQNSGVVFYRHGAKHDIYTSEGMEKASVTRHGEIKAKQLWLF